MKRWNALETAAAPKPLRSLVRSVLSATFATLVMLAGRDTVFPGAKHWITPSSWSTVSQPSSLRLPPEQFDWSQIDSNNHLEFHECNDGYQCAKLSLPLDYFNGTYPSATLSIAIAKLAARVPVDDPRYGGPILINPGGPGGAGALFALLMGSALQQVADPASDPPDSPPDARYYDIIGFDPRGIGMSEPVAKCMPDVASSWSWQLRENNQGILGSSDAALGRLWSMTHAFGSACKKALRDEDGPDIKKYMATAFVARDMLEITEKHAEHVAEQRAQLVARKAGKALGCHDTGYRPGEAQLQYWGFSYGTYLGTTFASMFPDRVGRVVLDGVVSSYDYVNSWGNGSLTDSEKAMESLYTFCHNAGPTDCALATPNGSTIQVKERFQKIIKSLYHAPLPISTPQGPEILTWSDVKMMIFSALYIPRTSFPFISTLLAAIEAGESSDLDFLVDQNPFSHIYSCPVNGTVPDYTSDPNPNVAATAILCGDGHDQTRVSMSEFEEYWADMDEKFPTAGSYWSMFRMRCAAWPIHASYSFRGPFGGNTSHPVLFVSNTADPVTPLRSARLMHSFFPGSGLLVADGAGHCSLSTPSACTLAYIRTYFQTGDLPAQGTVCVPRSSAWSVNSTHPKSLFHDSSLATANVVVARDEGLVDAAEGALHAAGVSIMEKIAESGVFGFQRLEGSRVPPSLVGFAGRGKRG